MKGTFPALCIIVTLALTGCVDDVDYHGGFRFDVMPPSVLTVSPAADALDVDLAFVVTVTFSEAIDPTSVSDDSVVLHFDGIRLPAEIDLDGAELTVTADIPAPFLTRVSAVVTTGLTDFVGHSLEAPFEWSFTTRDLVWSAAATLSGGSPTSPLGITPRVGIADSQSAIAVWVEGDVLASTYDGSSWSVPISINDIAGSIAGAELAVSTSGNAVAVWTQSDGTSYAPRGVAFDPSLRTWGPVTVLESSISGDTISARVAIAGDVAFAAWHQFDGSRYNVYARRYVTASGWESSEEPVESYTSGPDAWPDVCVDGPGRAAVVWQQQSGTSYRVKSAYWTDPAYEWGIPPNFGILVDDAASGSSLDMRPAIACDEAGNMFTIWRQTGRLLVSKLGAAAGGAPWGDPLVLSSAGTFGNSTIAFEPGGRGLVAWIERDGGTSDVHVRMFDGAWGPLVVLESGAAPNEAKSVTAGFDARGNASVAWGRETGARDEIRAARYNPATGWSVPVTIGDDPVVADVELAMSPSGAAALVWSADDGVNIRVKAAVLE